MSLTKVKNQQKQHVTLKFLKIFLLVIGVFIISYHFIDSKAIAATGTQVNVVVNYIDETAYITAGTGGSTKLYISMDKMKNWELIETAGVIDISALLSAKEKTIYFKGNKDTNPLPVVLQGEDRSLKVTYSVIDGVGRITYTSPVAVEYRKGTNGTWKTAYTPMFTSIYEMKGITLYFRTIATNVKRAGKVVSVKVPKRPNAPSVKADGKKLALTGLKPEAMEYRVGDSLAWIKFLPGDKKTKTLSLLTLLAPTATGNTPIPAGTIEVRTLGTNKKVTSAVRTIEVSLQPSAPDTISVTGTTLTITDPDKKRAYEYSIVENNSILNLTTARWTSVTSKNSKVIPKVSVGSKVLVRLKSKIDPTTKELILASIYKENPITSITPSKK